MTTYNPNNTSVPPGGGELDISVVSLNNLPTTETPSHVSVQACGRTVTTGSPLPCLEDKNSFDYKGTKDNTVKIPAKPLKYLWDTSFSVTVVYEKNPSLNLRATYETRELGINPAQNIVLQLEPTDEKTPTTVEGECRPSIQIQAHLLADYRKEIKYCFRMGRILCTLMDAIERNIGKFVPSNRLTDKLFMLPIVPALIAAAMLTPFVAGGLAVLLPFAVPVLAALVTTGASLLLAFFLLLCSTSRGRQHIVDPAFEKLCHSSSGQCLLFPVGPRPTPVDAVEWIVPENKWGRLILSLAIDIIGCSSYLLPFLGEAADLVWAPIQTVLIMAMYNETSPKLKYLSFFEEILPFTDAVPSATIGWLAQFGPEFLRGKKKKVEVPDDLKFKEE